MTQNKKILAIDNNKRLDKFCLKELKHTSFAHVLKNIKLGNILVNETTKPANYKLQTNDVVTFNLNLAVKKAVVSTIVPPMKLDVVYEDKNILVINKPAGLSSHSDTNNTDSLLKQAQAYYRPQHLSIQLCNRLDKNTAGLIVLTKNDLAHTEMNKLIMQHDVKKYYLCKIYGAFIKPHQILKDWLTILSDDEGYGVEINKNELIGKSVPIITEYTCIDHDANNNSILEINLLTGKKHQIRAHLAFYGHPVYGEQKYVSKKIRQMSKHQHQQLYSYKIQFVVTNKESILYYLNGKTISLDKDNIIDILKKI